MLVSARTRRGIEAQMIRVDADNAKAHEGIRALVDSADQRQLEALRDVYVDRLHRRSNDFDATYGLRLVAESLRRFSLGPSTVTSSS
jgi:hypothetical protein